ncbi:MAG: cell filamentation protein Fic, partial [Bacteroidales bacterium]|nr:cell filamentation protein Fic [Bacteroidales bacterium]
TTKPLAPLSENVRRLIQIIAIDELSVKEMMNSLGLKDRKNFLEYSLNPAIRDGYARLKFPDSPRHPRQRYLLTVKGLIIANEIE